MGDPLRGQSLRLSGPSSRRSVCLSQERGISHQDGWKKVVVSETRREATNDETLVEPFVDIYEGDRLTLTYERCEGDERTVRAEAATDAKVTERSEDDTAAGNVAFWYRDLERAEGDADGVPFARVRYRPVYSGTPPTVRVHGHVPTSEATAGIEYLGDVVRAVVDESEVSEA